MSESKVGPSSSGLRNEVIMYLSEKTRKWYITDKISITVFIWCRSFEDWRFKITIIHVGQGYENYDERPWPIQNPLDCIKWILSNTQVVELHEAHRILDWLQYG